MSNLISSIGVNNIGLSGLVMFIMILLLTGGLIPRTMFKRALKDKDDQIKEWRETHIADLDRNREQAMQITRLLDASRTTTHLIHSMQQEVTREIETLAIDTQANVDSQLYDRNRLIQPAAPQTAITTTTVTASSTESQQQRQPRKRPSTRVRSQPAKRAPARRGSEANNDELDDGTDGDDDYEAE